ncbi:hypothetical protein NXS19_010026 [Fusarium pseudograminearum]|nr:hypothetical protein NXS19_010026 [Fusarium pseudograminearum]
MGKRETPATSTTTPSPTHSVHGKALPNINRQSLVQEQEQRIDSDKGKAEVPHRELVTSVTKPGNISPGDNDTVVREHQQDRRKEEMAKDDIKTQTNVIPPEKRAGLVEGKVKVARASEHNPQKSLEDLPKNDDRAKEPQLLKDGNKTETDQRTSVDEKDVPDGKAEAKAEQTTAKMQGSTAPGAYQTTPGCTKKKDLDAGKADRAPEREATDDHVKGFGFSKPIEDPRLTVPDKPGQKKHTNYDKSTGVKPPRGL